MPPAPIVTSERVLKEIAAMEKAEFREKFKDSNFYWRGQAVIRRNCLRAGKNMKKTLSGTP